MNDNQLELLVSKLLRAGVLTALAIVSVGGVIHLLQNYSHPVGYATFQAEDPNLRTVPGIWKSARRWDGRALIQLGLLVLVATPIARVAMAAVGFALERDRLYAVISLIVLAILTYSIAHAL